MPPARMPTVASTPTHASQPDDAPPPTLPRLDARRAHVLDRAAVYVQLADEGLSAAQIARRRRKSPAHVSILLRLGRALADVPADERAALRSPRVTWRLVQRLVRADTDAASLRRQLRAAVGGFSTHNVDRRRTRRAGAAAGAAPPGAPPPGVAWGWDAAWFARDPAGYAAAHLAHLTHLHAAIAARAAQAVRERATAAHVRADTGQSLRGLQRRLAQIATTPAPELSASERDALATLAAVGAALAAAAQGAPAAPPRPAPSAAE